MPKYYRFRATTPNRKTRRVRDSEKDTKEQEKTLAPPKLEPDTTWLDLTLSAPPAPSWYLRRISWRESAPLLVLPRPLTSEIRTSLQSNNRSVFVLKFPSGYYAQM